MCLQYISAFGGTFFHAQVEFLDKVTRICVSPALGISEEKVSVNDVKYAPIYSPIVDFSDVAEVANIHDYCFLHDSLTKYC